MMKPVRKIPTPQSLTHVALHYLGRYAASEASLRRVLMNRLRRATMQHLEFTPEDERYQNLLSAIETIIASHQKTGAINDASFAETKINSLRRQGRSKRVIQMKLGAKGIKPEIITAALAQQTEEETPDEAERKAALTHAAANWVPFGGRPEMRRNDARISLSWQGRGFLLPSRAMSWQASHRKNWNSDLFLTK